MMWRFFSLGDGRILYYLCIFPAFIPFIWSNLIKFHEQAFSRGDRLVELNFDRTLFERCLHQMCVGWAAGLF